MQRDVIVTDDGSSSIAIPEMNVTYHSKHGAIQESQHIFIREGFDFVMSAAQREKLNIFEVGFGTGLNALLTLARAEAIQQQTYYTAIELFPVTTVEAAKLNYCDQLARPDLAAAFEKLHSSSWEHFHKITSCFNLCKLRVGLLDLPAAAAMKRGPVPTAEESSPQTNGFITPGGFDLIYFDAFAPAAQPELWSADAFKLIQHLMSPGGVLLTYCSKSSVRKAMQEAGLRVTKLPGPPGKREIVRAFKD